MAKVLRSVFTLKLLFDYPKLFIYLGGKTRQRNKQYEHVQTGKMTQMKHE